MKIKQMEFRLDPPQCYLDLPSSDSSKGFQPIIARKGLFERMWGGRMPQSEIKVLGRPLVVPDSSNARTSTTTCQARPLNHHHYFACQMS